MAEMEKTIVIPSSSFSQHCQEGWKRFLGNHDCDRVHGYDYLHMSGPVAEYEHLAGNCTPRQKSDRRWPSKYTCFCKSNLPPKARSLRKQPRISLRLIRSSSTSGAIWLLIFSHLKNTRRLEMTSPAHGTFSSKFFFPEGIVIQQCLPLSFILCLITHLNCPLKIGP